MPEKRENIQITINADHENMIGKKSTITQKTYGPFKMSIPKLDNNDMYKYIENTSWKVLAYGIYARVVDVSEIERVSAATE